jgi:hypothetical protein
VKLAKDTCDYTPKGTAPKHCSVCVNYIVPQMCRKVAGNIPSQGWCKYFLGKAT